MGVFRCLDHLRCRQYAPSRRCQASDSCARLSIGHLLVFWASVARDVIPQSKGRRIMKQRNATMLAIVVAGLMGTSALAPAVSAQPKGPKERREDRKERREDRQENRKERREDRQDNRKDRREDRKDRREDRQEARKDRRGARHDRGKARRVRRRAARKAFLAKWGRIHKRPAVNAELRLHAWRMARMGRLRTLATENSKDDAVKRIDELKAKEMARHQKRMEGLKKAAPPAGEKPEGSAK